MTDPQTARALFMALHGDNSTKAQLEHTIETAEAAGQMMSCANCGAAVPKGTDKCPSCGEDPMTEMSAALTMKQRSNISPSDFVFPEKAPGAGSYPIHDRAHGGYALQRASGKPEEAKVRAVVCKRYSDLPSCQS